MNTTKPFSISKQLVWESYKLVKANKGAAGVDEESINDFDRNLEDNLYKLWNRMTSGSYFPPPVRMVEIPKGNGGTRKLGIPTVSDRIAQMTAKLYFEPELEKHFHNDSFGYRPNKSAHDAIAKARVRCWKKNWVIDLDIKGFFDNLDHDLLMRAVEKHTECKWLKLYIKRWLTAPVELTDGQVQERTKGTPQGGVISPLLANLFLHYAFDKWLEKEYPNILFERYADDAVVHCSTQTEAELLMEKIKARLMKCHLELHPDKTKIVYCKDDNRKGNFSNTQFDFLGYTFRPRRAKSKIGKYFTSFSPAISKNAANKIRKSIKDLRLQRQCYKNIDDIAKWINPKLNGWFRYYGKYHKTAMYPIFSLLNIKLSKWAKKKYKKLRGKPTRASQWLGQIAKREPKLFVHWQLGIRPSAG